MQTKTPRGNQDLVRRKKSYQVGKEQLAKYLKLEGTLAGYYVVSDYRQTPEPLAKTEQVARITIRSYVMPIVQERPSAVTL